MVKIGNPDVGQASLIFIIMLMHLFSPPLRKRENTTDDSTQAYPLASLVDSLMEGNSLDESVTIRDCDSEMTCTSLTEDCSGCARLRQELQAALG